MTVLGFPVADLMARLQGIAELADTVTLAPDLDALATPPRQFPAVAVVTETRGGAVTFTGPPVQQDRQTFVKLFVWVQHHAQQAAETRTAMDALLALIDARLAGWTPGNAFSDLRFTAARDEFSQGAHLVVQAIYRCDWTFSAPFQP